MHGDKTNVVLSFVVENTKKHVHCFTAFRRINKRLERCLAAEMTM